MKELGLIYGKPTYDKWIANPQIRNLRPTRIYPTQADDPQNLWNVTSFTELADCVAFLTSMNKSLILYYRGQVNDCDPIPGIFRGDWKVFGTRRKRSVIYRDQIQANQIMPILNRRPAYWHHLQQIENQVYNICHKVGLARWRGLYRSSIARWAIIQHYGIWPTPLLDLSTSLRIAASFALDNVNSSTIKEKTGYVYIVGLPHIYVKDEDYLIHDSLEDQLILARLQSICPPSAKRPHYQDGFLIGDRDFKEPLPAPPSEDEREALNRILSQINISNYPNQLPNDSDQTPDNCKYQINNPLYQSKTNRRVTLFPRIIAKFKLINHNGEFWKRSFPIIPRNAVYPNGNDKLYKEFAKYFGPNGDGSIKRRVLTIEKQFPDPMA